MKNFTWSWDEPDEDERKDEIDYPESPVDDIDRLFEESDEEQCLDTDVEDKLTETEGLKMTNEQMIADLKNMAGQALRMWGIEEDSAKESLHTQAYALCCTAIAALNAPKPFIQIGGDIFNRVDIIRVAIENYPDLQVGIYTREIVPGPENEGFSYSFHRSYPIESDEAKALLDWLEPQMQVLF